MTSQHDLAREVFGGSESELSSDDEETQLRQQPRTGYESSESEDEEGEPVKRRVARKRKREVEMTPLQLNRARLDQRIEAILKGKKTTRVRKKKNEEVLDSLADNEVAQLREAMNAAADEDHRANGERQPAMAKLRLLPEAMDTLQKASLAQSMMDNNLLEAVKRWLEPLPDRSLPALNIQRELFSCLRKMEFIDSAVLKESGLGRVVLFYTKCKRVRADIGRIAQELVLSWSRPIIKRSASYRDRVVPTTTTVIGHSRMGLEAILSQNANDGRRRRRNAVNVPHREFGTYNYAPNSNLGLHGNEKDVERRRKHNERIKSFSRKVGLK